MKSASLKVIPVKMDESYIAVPLPSHGLTYPQTYNSFGFEFLLPLSFLLCSLVLWLLSVLDLNAGKKLSISDCLYICASSFLLSPPHALIQVKFLSLSH